MQWSISTDTHPTPEGTKPRDHVISSQAHGRKNGRLSGVLPLSFYILDDLVP